MRITMQPYDSNKIYLRQEPNGPDQDYQLTQKEGLACRTSVQRKGEIAEGQESIHPGMCQQQVLFTKRYNIT